MLDAFANAVQSALKALAKSAQAQPYFAQAQAKAQADAEAQDSQPVTGTKVRHIEYVVETGTAQARKLRDGIGLENNPSRSSRACAAPLRIQYASP